MKSDRENEIYGSPLGVMSDMHKFHASALHFRWHFVAAISSAYVFYWRLIDGNETNQGSLFRSIKSRHSFDWSGLSSRINSLFFLFSHAVLFHEDLRAFICPLNRRSWLFSRMRVRIARIYRRTKRSRIWTRIRSFRAFMSCLIVNIYSGKEIKIYSLSLHRFYLDRRG